MAVVRMPTAPGGMGADPRTAFSGSSTASGTQGWMQDPDIANVVLQLMQMGLTQEQSIEILAQSDRQFTQQLEYDKWRIEQELANSLEIARTSSSASARIAAANRAATLEAARIDAKARIETARIDAAARIKTVAMQVAAQLKDIVATTTARPIDWVKQTAMLGGIPEAQAPSTGVQQYLQAPVPGVSQAAVNAPLWNPAATSEGDAAWQAFRSGQPVAPQAVVGERGPELATATPRGTVIQPLPRRGFGGTRRMATGGVVTPNPTTQARQNPFLQSRIQDAMRAQRAGGQRLVGLSGSAYNWMQQPQGQTPQQNQTTGQMSMADWQKQLWGGWPAFQATTLSRSPAALKGGTIERWPWEENLNDFLNAPAQVQQARLGAWRAAGVIAGETLDEMWNSAMGFMTRAGFVGAQRGLTTYG